MPLMAVTVLVERGILIVILLTQQFIIVHTKKELNAVNQLESVTLQMIFRLIGIALDIEYNGQNGCDCNCGAYYPDCDQPSQKVIDCDQVTQAHVSCVEDNITGNALCKYSSAIPLGWSCDLNFLQFF